MRGTHETCTNNSGTEVEVQQDGLVVVVEQEHGSVGDHHAPAGPAGRVQPGILLHLQDTKRIPSICYVTTQQMLYSYFILIIYIYLLLFFL